MPIIFFFNYNLTFDIAQMYYYYYYYLFLSTMHTVLRTRMLSFFKVSGFETKKYYRKYSLYSAF